jgi:hypothetical protein
MDATQPSALDFFPANARRLTGNLDWTYRLYCNEFAMFCCADDFAPCSGLPTDDVLIQRDGANGFAFSQNKSAFPDSDALQTSIGCGHGSPRRVALANVGEAVTRPCAACSERRLIV